MSINMNRTAIFLALTATFPLSTQLALADESSAPMLEEVIVTAQKRAESLQDTPISVVAFDTNTLENRGIHTLVDVGPNVPNLHLTPHPNSGATVRVFIRGVGNNDDQITQDPSVATYMDGVYLARSQGLAMEVGDIERIEVLRGPQGSLYGRNATGGAINFVTVAPSLDSLEFKQAFTVGSRNEFRSKTTLNLPVSENFAVKLGYLIAKKDGFVDNLGTGERRFGDQDRTAYRLDALWRPSDRMELRYAYDRSEIDDSPVFVGVVPLYPEQAGRPDAGDPNVTGLQANDITTQGHTLTVAWDINDDISLKSITGYRELDSDQYQDFHTGVLGPFVLFGAPIDTEQEQFTQEFQLLGSAFDNSLDYILGAYYFNETADGSGKNIIPIQQKDTGSTSEVENTAYALFGQATYTPQILEQRLHMTLGMRWSVDEREASLAEFEEPYGSPVVILPPGTGDADFDEFTPSLVVAYDLTDDVNVYGKVVTGYKTGGFNTRASSIELFEQGFDSETLISYELGIKSEFWDNRIRLNGAVFFSDYEDIQVSVPSDITDPTVTDVLNAGEAEIKGLELDLTALLTQSLTMTLGYGYLDAEYTVVEDATGADVSDQFRFLNAPEHNYNLDLEYVFPSLPFGELSATLNYSWQDEKFTSSTVTGGEFIVDDYGLLNARLALTEIPISTGDLRVALWGRNLDDEDYYVSHFRAGFPSAIWGEERSYGIDIIYEY
ncbi:MAG: TonB-dependent receptor [Halioglobus sp.]